MEQPTLQERQVLALERIAAALEAQSGWSQPVSDPTAPERPTWNPQVPMEYTTRQYGLGPDYVRRP